MSAEYEPGVPERAPLSDVRAERGHIHSLAPRLTALTPVTVSPTPPRSLSPLLPTPGVNCTAAPLWSSTQIIALGAQTGSGNRENCGSSGSGSSLSYNCYGGAQSSAPVSSRRTSRATAPCQLPRRFPHSDTASSSMTALPTAVYLHNTKAGLQTVDKEKREAFIKELSVNSSFYANEERKAQRQQLQIEELLVKTRQYKASVRGDPVVFRQLQRQVAELEASFEAHRRFDCVYVHVDMDMFYAAVEMKKNPQYAEMPLGIGDMSMLSTTNYVARKFGVQSGMPGFIGMRLCPQLVIVPTNFAACRVESRKFMGVVREYDPAAHVLGMDEIMMCLDGYLAQHHSGATTHTERFDIAERIVEDCRRRIAEATGLTASAGIAPTPTLAKMASNYKKPDGQYSVRLFSREAVMSYLADIPVRQVPGIGKSRERLLAGLGIHTLGDAYQERHRLFYILTPKTFEFLLASTMGVGGMYDPLEARLSSAAAADGHKKTAKGDGEPSEDDWVRKSVGHERTFSRLASRADLQAIAYENLRRSHETLAAEDLLSSQVVLKLKLRSFHVKQQSKSLNVYTDDHEVLRRALDELLIPLLDSFAEYRLLGVRLEKLRRRPQSDGGGSAATLRHFFARRLQSNAPAAQQGSRALRKRYRDTSGGRSAGVDTDADLDDSDGEDSAVLVSSESQSADVEGVKGPVASIPALSSLSACCAATAVAEQKRAHEEVIGDNSADDDVVIVE
ncbi:hypothetical protein LSCM1_03165 [Leishmania martiniquensis]|uniref:DNA polymerase kappa n=1 Tax=Leishmania martiniquensis TaxID=1580590 RepID=A0A836HCJ9_9TRYP|nr:hypothetical protein LSCM1_03165 [Leishmania martiniquensis]